MRTLRLIVLVALTTLLAACASSSSGSAYSRDEVRKTQTVKTGVVESVRAVKIEGTKTAVGPATGAVVGGVAGSTVGHGKGRTVATVVGAVAGGLAGAAIEEGVTRKDGIEITVKLDSGGLVAVVQEADEQFRPGEKVRILESGGTSRVSH